MNICFQKVILLLILILSYQNAFGENNSTGIVLGAERFDYYLPKIKNSNIALVVNNTSRVNNTHLVDLLLEKEVNIVSIFSPEHGFRGNKANGENISNSVDPLTSLPIVSLYGEKKKPTQNDLKNVDVVLFDIQDIGVRFYTYISTMHMVMEACAEKGIRFIVLDRPNPNGDYVDGPVLETKSFSSFVGMHPIPVVHGLTVGELALMINKEGWLGNGLQCNLTVVPMVGYNHGKRYKLPTQPSPNLPNSLSIRLYPHLCFFEATNVSIGRGTDTPFQVFGYPKSDFGSYKFIPNNIQGVAQNPKQKGKVCFGEKLNENDFAKGILDLSLFIELYHKIGDDKLFFSSERWFNLLIGNSWVLSEIKEGKTTSEIRKKWLPQLNNYNQLRKNYLLYP